jgi:hypothetical protein
VEPFKALISVRDAQGGQTRPRGTVKEYGSDLPLDNSMLRILTVVQQFMTEFSGAASEEEKIVTVTKIFSNLMKQNDH